MNRLQYYMSLSLLSAMPLPMKTMQQLFEIFLYATNNLRDILSHYIT